MSSFDQISLLGTPSTQQLIWRSSVYRLSTSSTGAVTIATLAIAASTGVAVEIYLEGRQTTGNITEFERGCCTCSNSGGVLTLITNATIMSAQAGFYTYSSSTTNTPFITNATLSGTNLLINITPKSAAATDWSCWIDLAIV